MTTSNNQTKGSNFGAIERATGIAWDDWARIFVDAGALTLAHPEIAKIAREHVPEHVENPDWWAQGIAIAFEQANGLRVPGQASDGTFRVGVSRALDGDRDSVVELWRETFGDRNEHRGHEVQNIRESRTAKRTFWRAKLEGAGNIEIAGIDRDGGRAGLSVEHTALDSGVEIEAWRAYWKGLLGEL